MLTWHRSYHVESYIWGERGVGDGYARLLQKELKSSDYNCQKRNISGMLSGPVGLVHNYRGWATGM